MSFILVLINDIFLIELFEISKFAISQSSIVNSSILFSLKSSVIHLIFFNVVISKLLLDNNTVSHSRPTKKSSSSI